MADFTPNYNLKKPLRTEYYNVADANGNSDIVDTQLKAVNDRVDLVEGEVDALESGKVDKVVGKQLSDENYTLIEKNKVANLPDDTNAQLADIANGTGIEDKAIDLSKTNFSKVGKNLFDKSKVMLNTYIASSGSTFTLNGYDASDWIPIEPNTAYAFQKVRLVAWYDSNKTHISQVANNDANIVRTSPANAVYARLGLISTSTPLAQVEKGEAATSYEPFKLIITSNYIEKFNILESDIPDNLISPKKTNFIQNGKNLFDKSKAIDGYYVSQTTGTLGSNASHFVSDFIPITPNTDYVFSYRSELRVCFYSPNKGFISGAYNPVNGTITSPTGAYYLKFSNSGMPGKDSQQLEVGTVATAFEAYGLEIPLLLSSKQEEEEEVIINLPAKIYALVGQELNIYFDNIVSGKDTDYDFDVICGKGKQYDNFWRFVPDVAETRSININAYKNGKLVGSVASTIIVSSSAVGSGISKKIIVIGDSTTDNGIAITKLNDNFASDVMDIETIGTRGTGTYKHEGRSGWTVDLYTTVAQSVNGQGVTVINSFWNPNTSKFDFSYYISNNALVSPDYVVINLGINDVFSIASDSELETKIQSMVTKYNEIIGSIKAYSSGIKVGIALTIPPNYRQDAFGKAYGSSQTRTRYKRNNILLVKNLIQSFGNREAEGVYLIPTHTNLDTRYNMGLEETQVNARNTETYSSPIANGGVHPVDSGYWQIADVYWYWLKSFEM